MNVLSASKIRKLIPKRPAVSNKGNNGHLLIIAGSRGMTGAAYLCALGALKSGAGLVTVGAPEAALRTITDQLPESMTIPLPGSKEGFLAGAAMSAIQSHVRRRTITTLAAGPGLSIHASVRSVIKGLLNLKLPLVLDADGLNNIRPIELTGKSVVITPHPGELARLLGTTVKKIQADRIHMAQETARRFRIVCVLKGHRTVISDGPRVFINPTGNPAMATGGMGDVLTGVIAGFLAQKLSLFDAACVGVYLHGLAGDMARVSDRGLLASELANSIPMALKKIGIA